MRRAVGVGALLALLAACGGPSGSGLAPARAGANDINPQPREAVGDGGTLRWPLTGLPDNYNRNHFMGSQVETQAITGPLLPSLFSNTADGGQRLNGDYLTSADVTSTAPMTVRYVINPRAAWTDGTPISWRDFAAQWRVRTAGDPLMQTVSRTGYEDIASVERGADDKQVLVTFARPFAEWKSLFSQLMPASSSANPAAFNTGWINQVPVSAGPFVVESIDRTAKTVTLKRSDSWWGERPKLEKIIFRAMDRAAQADALANNEIDFYEIGNNLDLFRRAQTIPGVHVRQARDRLFYHITFNGAPGATLSDVRLRRAVAKGIDRGAIARRLIGQIVPDVQPLGNRVTAFGGQGHYRDNSGELPFDPAAAERELDALGWVRPAPGAPRAKDGKPLTIRMLEGVPNPTTEQIDKTVLDQLARIGVTLRIDNVPLAMAATNYKSGNFDLVCFGWSKTSSPISGSRAIYAEPRADTVQQNYGRIWHPEIDALFRHGITELDDAKRAELGNQADALIWREVHSLPLWAGTGAYAVRDKLANFGAPGYAEIDYTNAGFVK